MELESVGPPGSTDRIVCQLHTISLDDKPGFIALSYVWGDSTVTEQVLVDGVEISITKNLANGLRQAFYHLKRRAEEMKVDLQPIVWADALCINQADLDEKNHQIPLMKSIYSSAAFVVASIGTDNAVIRAAVPIFKSMSSALDPILEDFPRAKQMFDSPDYAWLRKCPVLLAEDSTAEDSRSGNFFISPQGANLAWDILVTFCQVVEYFDRVWIMQELMLAKFIFLVSDNCFIDWRDVITPIGSLFLLRNKMQERPIPRPGFIPTRVWSYLHNLHGLEPFFTYWAYRENLGSGSIKQQSHHIRALQLSASDPRDNVYGVLGITDLPIEVDYRKSVGEVFADYAGFLFDNPNEKYKISILQFSGVGRCTYAFDVPTWVPITKAAVKNVRGQLEAGKADWRLLSGIENTEPAVVGLRLVYRGTQIDTIKSIAYALDDRNLHGSPEFHKFLRDFIMRQPSYISGITPLQAIFRTLMRNREPLSEGLLLKAWAFFACLLFAEPEAGQGGPTDSSKLLMSLLFKKGAKSMARTFHGQFIPEALSRGREFGDDWIDKNFIKGLTESPAFTSAWFHVRHKMEYSVNVSRLFESSLGYLVLGPKQAAEGDIICVLKGCHVPVILRKVEDHYIHVGTCFVQGLMEGEAADMLEAGKLTTARFEIH